MPTIDDIRIKLAVDGADVRKGVDAANTALKGIERGSRTVSLQITAKDKTGDTLKDIGKKIADLGAIPITAGIGGFDAKKLSGDLQEEMLKPEYGIKIPVGLDTKLTKQEAMATRKAIEKALSDNNVIVTVDWQFAAEPKGGWPGGGGPARGGGAGGGPGPAGPGPTGGKPRGGGPAAPAGPAPAGEPARAKRERTAAQRTNDERIKRDLKEAKRAREAGDKDAAKKAADDLKAARAEQRRNAKEAREAERETRRTGTPPPPPAAGAAPAPTPPPPPPAGPAPEGLGGRRGRQRAAAQAPKATPTGAPRANVRTEDVAPPTTTTVPEAGRPFQGRRPTLGAPEKGAFVGKGANKPYRGGSRPRDLMPRGEELTPEGIREFQKGLNVLKAAHALMGTPVSEGDVADLLRTFPKEYFFSVAQGETPATVNPEMGTRIERGLSGGYARRTEAVPSIGYAPKMSKTGKPVLDKEGKPIYEPVMGPKKPRTEIQQVIQGRRGEALATWAAEMRAQGVGAGLKKPEEVQDWWRTGLTGKEKRRLYERMGLPDVEGQISDPLSDPATAEAFLMMLAHGAEEFNQDVAESGGANVRLKAGTRKGPVRERQSEITGTEQLKTTLGRQKLTKEERAERKAEIDRLKADQAARAKKAVQVPPELKAEAAKAAQERKRRAVEAGIQAGTISIKTGPNATAPEVPKPTGPDLRTLAGAASAFAATPGGPATPATYEDAFARQLERRYARLRHAAGMQPLTTAERAQAMGRGKFAALSREDLGLPRFTIPGFAEGGTFRGGKFGPQAESPIKIGGLRGFGESAGAGPNIGRQNPYWWKKLSGSLLKQQPYCTLCGMGRAESRRTLGKDLTIGHIQSQAHGGEHEPGNLMPLCSTCNSWMGQASFSPLARWNRPRPGNITKHPKLQGATPDDFRPGGRLFGVGSIRDALKAIRHRDAGGRIDLTKHPAWRKGFGDVHFPYGPGLDHPGLPRLARDFVGGEIAHTEGWMLDHPTMGSGLFSQRGPWPGPFAGQDEDLITDLEHYLPWMPMLMRHGIYKKSRLKGHAEGGEIKHTGLASSNAIQSVTEVGERGSELIVQGANGQAEVIPHHEVAAWVQRMREGKLRGHIISQPYFGPGRAEGGGLRMPAGSPGGVGGQFVSPDPIKAFIAGQGGAQRVIVVNWPASLTGMGGGRPGRQVPVTPSNKPLASLPAQGPILNAQGQPIPPAIPRRQPLPGAAGFAAGQPVPMGLRPSDDPVFLAKLARGLRMSRFTGREQLQEERTKVAVALAENPVRAFAVAFSQFVQTRTGRAELLQRAGGARVAIQEADAAKAQAVSTARKLALESADYKFLNKKLALQGQLTKAEQEDYDTLQEILPQRREALKFERHEADLAAKEAKTAAAGLGGLSDQLKNLAVGGASVITAGVAFRAAFAAMSASIELGVQTIGEFVERNTGYLNAAAQLGNNLADQTKQTHGVAEAAVAATTALAGLAEPTAEQLVPALAGRAAGIAAGQNLQQQVEMAAAARNIARQNQGLPPGFDISLIRGTGGPFNLGLLPGILSNRSIADELNLALQGAMNADQPRFSMAGAATGITAPGGILAGGVYNPANFGGKTPAQAFAGGGFAGPTPGQAFASGSFGPPSTRAPETDRALQAMADALKKGGSTEAFQFFGGTGPANFMDTTNETVKVLRTLGDDGNKLADTFETLRKQGYSLAAPTTKEGILALLDAYKNSALTQTPEELMRTLTARPAGPGGLSQIDVQMRDIARRGEFQRGVQLPAALALQFAANPLVRYPTLPGGEQRLLPKGPLAGPQFQDVEGTIGQYQAAFEKYAKYAEPAQARINQEITKGQETLKKWIGPELFQEVTTLGKDIKGIQLDLQQRGLNLAVSQYNNEIRIANRSLRYAQDFTKAIQGNVHDTIGGLQGENFLLSRQSQILGQQLQQRQINLQLAVAGFQVAGETPEERAARQAQAIAEAEFAQKQLDLQKSITANEFQIGLKQNADAIGDLTAQIKLLRESKAFEIDQAAAEKAIADMTAELEYLQAQAQSRFDQAVQEEQVFLGYVTQIEDASRTALTNLNNELTQNLIPAFIVAGKDAGQSAVLFVKSAIEQALVNELGNAGGRITWEIGPGNKRLPVEGASGLLFDTAGPADLTVGEAGNETVAVLRNPRPMSLPSLAGANAGGQYTFTMNFNGAQVRTNADITAIAKAVQDELNRALRLAGVR